MKVFRPKSFLTRKFLLIACLGWVVTFTSELSHAESLCIDTVSSASSGSLTDSGGGSGSYSNGENCGFLIQAGSGGDISLSFSSFNYEQGYDFVRIYDGTSSSGTPLGSFTGTTVPSNLVATSGNMYIEGDTDFSITRSGFVASWTTSISSSDSTLCSESSSSASVGTLVDSGGSSGNYSNSEFCQFQIQASPGDLIELTFSSFAYESGFDFLRVYDGSSTSDTLLGSFSGFSLPANLTASSGNMLIVSQSDSSVVEAGFSASWSTTVGSSCPAQTVADNFASISYSLNSGSQNWSSAWQEIGESNGPSAGQSRVNSSNCSSGQCLRIGEPSSATSWTNRGASRELDLSTASTATLSFNYFTGYASGTLTVDLDISSDGGSSWTTLQSYNVSSTSFTGVAQSFDISAYMSSNTQIRFISDGVSARAGLYVDDIVISYTDTCLPTALAEWHFDEASWTGSGGAVVEDQVGGTLDGTPSGGVDTVAAGQICRAGSFDGVNDYVSVPGIANHLADTASLSFWIKTNQLGDSTQWRAPGVSGIEESGGVDDVFWGFIHSSGGIGIAAGDASASVSTTQINDDQWHHVVVTRDSGSGAVKTYVDGTLEASSTSAVGVIGNSFSSLGRIEDTGGTPEHLQGDLDEVVIFSGVLTDSEVQLIYNNQNAGNNWDGSARTCPIVSISSLRIEHDGSGIHCANETVTVSARDGSNSLVSTYAEEVTLDTQTGRGTWTLVSGGGTLTDATANDGLATYQFVSGDGGDAVFALSYLEGVPTLDIEAWQTNDVTIRDDDTEGTLTFAPSGFTLTATALSNPPSNPINDPVLTQQAGTNFAIHLTAYGTTPTDSQCGVIESYQGARAIDFWLDRTDPATGTVSATVNGSNIASSSAGALAQTVTFSAGQAVVTAKYKDAGLLSFNVRDDTSFSSTMTGATNAFVVQPDYLDVTQVTSATMVANPAATSMTGASFVPSGEAFRVVVTARDAENDITPNFGLESAPESVRISSNSLVAPAGGRNGSTGDVTNGDSFVRTGAGEFTTTAVVFDEVGIIRLQAQVADASYLNTGLLSSPLSNNVGRFYPDHYALVSSAVVAACNNYTYADQDELTVGVSVEARNVLNTVVQNYDLGLVGASGVAAVSWTAENNNDGVDLGSRIMINASNWNAGEYVVSDSSAEFTRTAVPDGPFENLQLGIQVNDTLDGATLNALNMQSSASSNCVTGSSCDAQTVGGETAIRYGRISLGAGMSPEFEDLDLPMRAEYWDGNGFRLNALDDCTNYQSTNVSLSSFQDNLNLGETAAIQPLAGDTLVDGVPNVSVPYLLSAPGLGNDGSVLVEISVPSWLEFDWFGAGDIPPRERQTFGHYRGHDAIVYWDEITRQ